MAVIEERKSANGTSKYRAKVRVKGYPPQSKTFTRRTDAKQWAKKLEAAILENRIFPKQAPKRHTVAELVDRYILTRLPQKHPSTQEAQKIHLRWWKKYLGPYYLSDITSALIIEYREKLAHQIISGGGTRAPATLNRYMAAIAHAFTIAWKEWDWIQENPLRKISKLREPDGVIRFLNDNEQQQLLIACKNSKSPHLYLIVLIGLSTGMRLNEILTLTWRQVNLLQGLIIIHTSKNKHPRRVPFQGKALQEFKNYSKVRRIDSDLVFPRPSDPTTAVNIRKAWDNSRNAAGLKDFRFHDLRHTAASYYAMSGASTRDLCEIFGWKTLQMAMRYAHLSDSHTSKLAAEMSARFIDSKNI